jgi:endonuclease YncB( thermonuclease family)
MASNTKKLLIVLVAILIFVFGFWAGFEFCRENIVVTVPFGNSPEQVADYVGMYKVARVIDGDTIEIGGGEKVRYIGMDSPEMAQDGKPEECWAQKALEKNRELVSGKIVELRKDVSDRDKYGRLLRYVFVDGLFVNSELVREGFAKMANFPPDVRYQDEISAAETQAQKNKAGLWSNCPSGGITELIQ